jgi:hypothetical protein
MPIKNQNIEQYRIQTNNIHYQLIDVRFIHTFISISCIVSKIYDNLF